MGRLEFKGLVKLSPDCNGFCDCLTRSPSKVDVPGGKMDRYSDEGGDTYNFRIVAGIIGVDCGPFVDLSLVTFGFHP